MIILLYFLTAETGFVGRILTTQLDCDDSILSSRILDADDNDDGEGDDDDNDGQSCSAKFILR